MKITSRPQVARAAGPSKAGAAAPKTAAANAGAANAAAAPIPTTGLMGIPAEEVTPRVRTAIETLMKEVDRLRHDLEELKRRNTSLEQLADEDDLLPVVNRRAFVRELSRAMSFAQRYDQPSSVGYFDVNNMKLINDKLGHAAGDAALMHVARTLTENVRHSDVVGRLGGDEFGVIFSQIDDTVAGRKTAELAASISATPVEWKGESFQVTIAFGAYTFDGAEEPHDALEAADRAMYAQKTNAVS